MMRGRNRVLRLTMPLLVVWLAVAALTNWLLFQDRLRESRHQLSAAAEAGADLLAMVLAGRPAAEADGTPAEPAELERYLYGRLRSAPRVGVSSPLLIVFADGDETRVVSLDPAGPAGQAKPFERQPSHQTLTRVTQLARQGVGGNFQTDDGTAPGQLVAFAPIPGSPLIVLAVMPLSHLEWAPWLSGLIAAGAVLPLFLVGVLIARFSTRRLRHELADSRSWSREILRSSVDAIVTIDAQGRILAVNPAGLSMFGYTAEELIGRSIAMLMPERHAREHTSYLRHYLETGKGDSTGASRLIPGLRKDGTEIPLELSVTESSLEGARTFTGVLRDVADRIQVQDELQAQERLLKTLVNTLPLPIMLKDRAGRYRMVNEALASHFGVPAETMIGRTLSEILGPDSEEADRIEAAERTVLEQGAVLDLPEFSTRSADGEVRWQHLIKVPIRAEDGTVTGLIGLAEDITARREAEEELQRSRTRLLQAHRIALLASWEWDVESDHMVFSDELYELLGESPASLPADRHAFRTSTHPEDLPLLLERLAEVKRNGAAAGIDHRIIRADGCVRYVHQQFEVYSDPHGRPQRVLGVMQDVTERRQADQALKSSQRLLQTVFDTIPFPVTVKDRDSRYVMVNREWLRSYGADADSSESIAGRHTLEIESRPQEELCDAVALDRQVLSGREAILSTETHRTLRSGERRIFRAIKTGLRDESGDLIGVLSIDVDITDARDRQEALQAQQRLLRTVLDSLPHLVVIKDREGRYLAVNRAWQETYGVEEASVLGARIEDVPGRHPEDSALANAADAEVFEGGNELRIVESIRHNRHGERFHVEDIRTPLRNENGTVIGLVDVAMDVSERRRTQDALRQTMQHVALIQNIAIAANEAATPEEAFQVSLREVCRAEGWRVGHAYIRDPEQAEQFCSTGLWHGENGDPPQALQNVTRAMTPMPGVDLPGLAMASHRPVLIEDLRADQRFRRAEALTASGLVSGLAIPVLVGSEVMGVLEFFGEHRTATPALLELLAQVGTQLGRVVERHQAAHELRASEERFRNLIEGSIQGVVIMMDLKPVFANQSVADIFGYASPQAFLDRWSFARSFPPEQAARLQANHRARLRGENVPAYYETEAIRQDGRQIWLETNARRILWEGRPAIQVTTHEITERKQTEAALRSSESRFRRLIEGSSHGIVIHDQGVPLFANQAFANLFGYETPDDILAGGSLHALLDPEDVQRVLSGALQNESESAAGDGQVQATALKRDGTRIQVELYFQSIEWQGRRSSQITVLDVSDRVRLEGQLRQAQKMEAVGQLAGGVAHDFNNILQIIRGYAELARMRMNRLPEADYLDKVLQASQGASQVIRQLLTLSRREVVSSKPVHLNQLVQDLMQMVRRLIGEHIELSVETAAQSVVVQADRAMLEQVLLNLCVNARDAMPDGGKLTIGLDVEQISEDGSAQMAHAPDGRYAVITVRDTGTGMESEVREHIFEPFFTTKAAGKGTGLGLSTAYGIVQQHRGVMEVESEPGQGSVFRIYLPVGAGAVADRPQRSAQDVPGGTETVLVAEDDPGVLELMVQLLENQGYRVLTARDGDEALGVFADQAAEINLAILDVVMPRQSGRSVYESIHNQRPGLRVLFNTGYSAESLEDAYMRNRPFHVIRKPYTPRQLLEAVRDALDSPWPPTASGDRNDSDRSSVNHN